MSPDSPKIEDQEVVDDDNKVIEDKETPKEREDPKEDESVGEAEHTVEDEEPEAQPGGLDQIRVPPHDYRPQGRQPRLFPPRSRAPPPAGKPTLPLATSGPPKIVKKPR